MKPLHQVPHPQLPFHQVWEQERCSAWSPSYCPPPPPRWCCGKCCSMFYSLPPISETIDVDWIFVKKKAWLYACKGKYVFKHTKAKLILHDRMHANKKPFCRQRGAIWKHLNVAWNERVFHSHVFPPGQLEGACPMRRWEVVCHTFASHRFSEPIRKVHQSASEFSLVVMKDLPMFC